MTSEPEGRFYESAISVSVRKYSRVFFVGQETQMVKELE